VQEGISNPDMSYDEIAFTVQLTMLAMLGDAILGQKVRSRMGVTDTEQAGNKFQERFKILLSEKMRPSSDHSPIQTNT
jgi:hypothetical protein